MAMSGVLRAALALGLLTTACNQGEESAYWKSRSVRRWSVTSGGGSKLASDCTVWTSEFPSPAVPFDSYPAAKLAGDVGVSVSYEDNLATEEASLKLEVGEDPPGGAGAWCGAADRQTVGVFGGLECLAVMDAKPAAKLDGVELTDATPPEQGAVLATGFRATLTVIGPGPVTLGVPDTCSNGFPFSFTAMVIEP